MRRRNPLDVRGKEPKLRLVSSQDEIPKKPKKAAPKVKRKQPKHEIDDLVHKVRTAVTAFKRAKGFTTDAEVAESCKVSPTQLSYLMSDKPTRGVQGVTYWTIKNLADGLGVSLEWLAFSPITSEMERVQRRRSVARLLPTPAPEASDKAEAQDD